MSKCNCFGRGSVLTVLGFFLSSLNESTLLSCSSIIWASHFIAKALQMFQTRQHGAPATISGKTNCLKLWHISSKLLKLNCSKFFSIIFHFSIEGMFFLGQTGAPFSLLPLNFRTTRLWRYSFSGNHCLRRTIKLCF